MSIELGISLRTVRRRIASGTFRVARVGPRRLLIDASEISTRLTASHAALRLGISRRSLLRLLDSHAIPHVRDERGRVGVYPHDCDAWIAAHRFGLAGVDSPPVTDGPTTLAERVTHEQTLERRRARRVRRERARERERRELIVATAMQRLARRFLDARSYLDITFSVRHLAALCRRSPRSVYHDATKRALRIRRDPGRRRAVVINWRDAIVYVQDDAAATRAIVAVVVDVLLDPIGRGALAAMRVDTDVRMAIVEQFCRWISDRIGCERPALPR